MSRTTIKVELSTSGINKAIREVINYKREFLKKVDKYRLRLADEIANIASVNFSSATMEDIVGTVMDKELVRGGGLRTPDVNVHVSDRGNISVIVADGEDAIWCEFGAGVYHNGSVGSSPHPLGSEMGFTIGTYGYGRGKRQAWGYYNESGETVVTRGTPASMPMYNAAQEVMHKAIEIAREVFG